MLLKDVFDIGCSRLCATVVIAAVSPLARDTAHSANTLKYAAPLRVAALASSLVTLEHDPADPALWDGAQLAGWVRGVCNCAGGGGGDDGFAQKMQASSGFGGGAADADENAGPAQANVAADPLAAGGGAGADEVAAARTRKAAAAAEAVAAAEVVAADAAATDGAALRSADAQLDAAALVGSLTGVQFCALPEAQLHRMVLAQVGDAGGVALAKRIHSALWTLIVDAKTRGRRPDGTIITAEMEAAERAEQEREQMEKAAVWKEREKHLRAEH